MQFFDPESGLDLRETFEDAILDWPAVEVTTMFGCPSYRAGGVLFALLVTDGVVLTRLPETERDAVAAAFETGPFSGSSRPPEQWVQVDVKPDAIAELVPFVRQSYDGAFAEAEPVVGD